MDTGCDVGIVDTVTSALERGLGRIQGIVQDLQTALVKLRQSDRRRDAQYTDVTAIESLRSSTSGWTFHDPLQTPFSFMGRHLKYYNCTVTLHTTIICIL
ncbi:hypothetical protein ACOSQ3_009943 [Xanthoceras sorbifolium]